MAFAAVLSWALPNLDGCDATDPSSRLLVFGRGALGLLGQRQAVMSHGFLGR
jgi:hypothetical protein